MRSWGIFWNPSNPCLSDMLVSWPPVPFSCCLGQVCLSLRLLTWRYLLALSAPPVLSAHPLDVSLSSELTFLDRIFICSLFHLLLCLCSSTFEQTEISALSSLSLSYSFNTFLLLFVINKWAIFMDRLLITSLAVWILSDLVSLLSISTTGSDYPLLGRSQSLSAVLIFVDLLADFWYFDRLIGFHAD